MVCYGKRKDQLHPSKKWKVEIKERSTFLQIETWHFQLIMLFYTECVYHGIPLAQCKGSLKLVCHGRVFNAQLVTTHLWQLYIILPILYWTEVKWIVIKLWKIAEGILECILETIGQLISRSFAIYVPWYIVHHSNHIFDWKNAIHKGTIKATRSSLLNTTTS